MPDRGPVFCDSCRYRVDVRPYSIAQSPAAPRTGLSRHRTELAEDLADAEREEKTAIARDRPLLRKPEFEPWCAYWTAMEPGHVRRDPVTGEVFHYSYALCGVRNKFGDCDKHEEAEAVP